MKIGDKVKTINPIATGVIIDVDCSLVPYHIRLDKHTWYDGKIWEKLWYEARDGQVIKQIINKLK